MCEWKPEYGLKDYKCRHAVYGKSTDGTKDLCIYHSDQEDKDIDIFFQGIKDIYKSRNYNFRGFIFPEGFDFKKLQGETEARNFNFIDADFSETVFLGDVHFSKAEFAGEGQTSFERARFYGKSGTFFNGARFIGTRRTSFRGTEFSGEGAANFSLAEFGGKGGTYFTGAKFYSDGGTTFFKAQFTDKGRTSFIRAHFSSNGETNFGRAQFSNNGGTTFFGAQFNSKGRTSFLAVTFSGEGRTSFSRAVFSGPAVVNFSRARFSCQGATVFSRTEFYGRGGVNFSRTHFSSPEKTSFAGTKFLGEGRVSFSQARFSGQGRMLFNKTEFSANGGIFFNGAQFFCEGGTDFIDTHFSSKRGCSFSKAHFSGMGNLLFSGRTFWTVKPADFRNITVENPDKTTFDGVNLNHVRFLGTDLKDIKFNEIWWTNREYGKNRPKKRNMVFDETFQTGTFYQGLEWARSNGIIGTEKAKRISIRLKKLHFMGSGTEGYHYDVYRLYNQLRLNYEKTGRYHEAGDFFIGEMEMRRRGNFEKPFIRILLHFYQLFSFYGERPLKAFGWLFALWLVFGFIFKGMGIEYHTQEPISFLKDVCNGLMISLDVLALRKIQPLYDLLKTEPIVPFIKAVEAIFGALFLSLFVLAMNRKFRRTKD
jgi:hypothetical protein